MKTIVLLGDSLTFGYGLNRSLSFASLISKNINANLINKGINGSSTTDMLVRFTKDVIYNNPNILFILAGTNDILSNRPIKSIIDNLSIMIDEALSNDIKVILSSPPSIYKTKNSSFINYNDFDVFYNNLSILNDELSKLSLSKSIEFIDLFSLTNSVNDIFTDGVHLNEEGNLLLYKKIILKIKKQLDLI